MRRSISLVPTQTLTLNSASRRCNHCESKILHEQTSVLFGTKRTIFNLFSGNLPNEQWATTPRSILMRWIKQFLSHFVRNFFWRRYCPYTIREIATDFLDNHCPPLCAMNIDPDFQVGDRDPWFAWRRRIASIYGIAINYAAPQNDHQKRGWNKKLWSQYEACSPDELVDRVFTKTIELLRDRLRQTSNDQQKSQPSHD